MKDSELYMGQKLQLFLYLNAFANEDSVPAGTYYYKLSDDYLSKDDSDKAQLDGKTVNVEEVLFASDTSCMPDETSSITGVKISKPSTTVVIDEKGLALRMKYAKTLSEKAVDYMSDGVSVASPHEVGDGISCQYCPYGAICGYEKDVSGSVRKERRTGNGFMDAVLDTIKDD
jgi:ATP-dependent helicase/nuclease subunit B